MKNSDYENQIPGLKAKLRQLYEKARFISKSDISKLKELILIYDDISSKKQILTEKLIQDLKERGEMKNALLENLCIENLAKIEKEGFEKKQKFSENLRAFCEEREVILNDLGKIEKDLGYELMIINNNIYEHRKIDENIADIQTEKNESLKMISEYKLYHKKRFDNRIDQIYFSKDTDALRAEEKIAIDEITNKQVQLYLKLITELDKQISCNQEEKTKLLELYLRGIKINALIYAKDVDSTHTKDVIDIKVAIENIDSIIDERTKLKISYETCIERYKSESEEEKTKSNNSIDRLQSTANKLREFIYKVNSLHESRSEIEKSDIAESKAQLSAIERDIAMSKSSLTKINSLLNKYKLLAEKEYKTKINELESEENEIKSKCDLAIKSEESDRDKLVKIDELNDCLEYVKNCLSTVKAIKAIEESASNIEYKQVGDEALTSDQDLNQDGVNQDLGQDGENQDVTQVGESAADL